MRLRTDDDIYRARLVYLGPPGYTLPVQLPYAQYGMFVLLVPFFMFMHYLFTFEFERSRPGRSRSRWSPPRSVPVRGPGPPGP